MVGSPSSRPLIEPHRAELTALCRQHHVARLDLFGSAMRVDFEPERSDLDFVVIFDPMPPVAHKDAYFGLLESLETLFRRPIDLIEREAISNPYVLRRIEQDAETLYAAA